MPKNLLTLKELSSTELASIIDYAIELKKKYKRGERPELMKNKTLVMLFQKTSTRTRTSFEAGATQLGGHAIFLDWTTTQFKLGDIKDEARCIDRYADIVMARVLRHSDLLKMAEVMEKPLINGLCEKYHPCQTIADLQTMQEHLGSLKGKKAVYLGIANNVSNTLSLGCVKMGMHFTLCVPERHPISLDEGLLKEVKASGLYAEEKDPQKAVLDADVLYTDAWIDMELYLDPKFKDEKERRLKTFMPYQLGKGLLDLNKKALIMHDLPAHRGFEIDDYAMNAGKSVIFDQAENRLHAQKAILVKLCQQQL
ncbi:MAG: ornithine carbamoyltransferase [Deltaproteobacteria bacterium]|nr:ornithine carbamoyltransferase [Deltaproteobacteria bacterium]MBI2342284.1 ornithine carbamoyltransferase [Deltaproteobacteria bacterium]